MSPEPNPSHQKLPPFSADELLAHLSAIVESSDDAIVSKDLDSVIKSWNPAAERIFGYSAAEVIGKPITILIPEGREGEEDEILAKIRRGERVDHYETLRRKKDGDLINILLTVSPIRNREGKIIGASKVARDITFRKKAEKLESQFSAIVASSDDAILSKDLSGIIQSWNIGAQKIFGYTAEEIVGKPVTLLIPEGMPDEEPKILERLRRGESIDHYETVRKRKDGSLVHISLSVSPIRDARGQIIGASKIGRDVTRQKEIEAGILAAREELAELNNELEARVRERTASLNTAVSQMEEFSYSVSHDLRSPVRAMQAYATAVLEDYGRLLDETGQGFLHKIIRNAVRMDKLILDVLTYSRLARLPVEKEPISLEILIQDIIPHYPEMQEPRAKISIEAPLHRVLGHEPSLAQAISNILSNAVKFVAPGKVPEITIGSEKREGRVKLWIRDNGIGIPPEYQPRLFGMFERVNPEGQYEGTGIGLAIVRKAVEKMEGKVGVESDGRSGTSFWIELKAAPSS